MKPSLIHTHIHRRKTGVTRSIENVLPLLAEKFESYVFGTNIEGNHISKSNLKSLLFSDKQVVVHCHRNNEIMAMLKYRLMGAKFKLVATRHSATQPSWLTKLLLKKADMVISLVQSVHKDLEMENVLIPHGVNTQEFIPNEEVVLPHVSQKNIILNTGRIRKSKGQKTLVDACRILKDFPDWALVLVGKIDNDTFYKELRESIHSFGIHNQVYFFPETRDIVPFYQAASIFVAPSFSEGFALVTAEAMACECEVIATKNVGVHSEMISHGENGMLFEKGNSEELEKLLKGLISNPQVSLGKKARTEIERNWSAQLEANRLAEIYQSSYQK